MQKLLLLLVVLLSLKAFAQNTDDWLYDVNATQEDSAMMVYKSNGPMVAMSMAAAPRMMVKRSIGLSVGGAKDSNNFYENIKHNFLPKYASLTHEGTFYEHFFETGKTDRCKDIFCPTYAKAVVEDIYNGEKNYYLSVGLDSGVTDFKRKKLNLVVVLDISGSMSSGFSQYHYDRSSPNSHKTKMEIANKSIANMMKHLKDDDRFGVVLFDSRAYDAKPLNLVKHTDMEAIKQHILDIKPRGGTNWSAGYKQGLHLYNTIDKTDEYENRIIFLTDAMPNLGELSKDKLFGMVKNASNEKIHTTFIGIGVDFNNKLVESITKTRGANYYAVHNAKAFDKRLNKEFEYMVTPLVYDVNLEVQSNGFQIDAVYGSPEANEATGEVLKVSTLFASAQEEGKVKGGVILVKLKNAHRSKDLSLNLSYSDANGKKHRVRKKVQFQNDTLFYAHSGIKKAIYLTQYVDLMKNWMLDENKGCPSQNNTPPVTIMPFPYETRGLIYPPRHPHFQEHSKWEQHSCKLHVSKGYKKIFAMMQRHLQSDNTLGLTKEIATIKGLINKKGDNSKRDDWIIK